MTTAVIALSLSGQIEKYGAYAGLAAVLGLAVLSLLYFAQAREVKRLREWAGRAPERAAELEERASTTARTRQPAPAAGLAVPATSPQAGAAPAVGAPAAGAAASSSPARPPGSAPVPAAQPVTAAAAAATASAGARPGEIPAAGAPTNGTGSGAAVPAPGAPGQSKPGEAKPGQTAPGGAEPAQPGAPAPVAGQAGAAAATAAASAGVPPAAPPAGTPASPAGTPASPAGTPASPAGTPAPGAGAPDGAAPPAGTPGTPASPAGTPGTPAAAAGTPAPKPAVGTPLPLPSAAKEPAAPARAAAAASTGPASASPSSRPAPLRVPATAAGRAPATAPRASDGRGGGASRTRTRMIVASVGGVVLIGVVLVVLVTQVFDGGGDAAAPAPNTVGERPATSTDADGGTAPAAGTTRVNRGDFTVAVLNGTTITNLARGAANKIADAGFVEGPVTNDTTNQARDATVVYYAEGARAAALDVARLIKVRSSAVRPLNSSEPTEQGLVLLAGEDADVIVSVGQDQAQ